MFRKNTKHFTKKKEKVFSQHEHSGTPQKLIDVHLAEYKGKHKYKNSSLATYK